MDTAITPKSQKELSVFKGGLAYKSEHYREHITIEEIAGLAGFQSKYFCRFFKKHMNQTYLEYLNSLRFSMVFQDMMTTGLPVSQLLEAHGYTNCKHFSRQFKEIFHTTPAAFRKLRKN